MLRVPIAYAKPGMTLALPIRHPRRPDTVLLKEGITLDERAIERLIEIRPRDVWIQYPGTEFICNYYCKHVLEAQAHLTAKIGEAFDVMVRESHVRLEWTQYRQAVAGLIERLLARPKSAIFIQELAGGDRPMLRHASAVCMLSVLMGIKLDDYLITQRSRLSAAGARDLTGLGLGAMMHDLGMTRLPPEVVERWNATLDESDPEWRAHVHIGFEMCKDALGPAAASAVLHHHQKFDGSGFPRRVRMDGTEDRVRGSDIHVFARIVAAADVFDRLRHPPGAGPDDPPVPVVRVLKQMQAPPASAWIDPMVFRALMNVAPAYAPGTLVALSTGERGVVTDWFPEDPCRPNVQLVDEDRREAILGKDGQPVIVNLRSELHLSIAQSEGHDVTADNFYPAFPGQFDLKLARRALFNKAAKVA